MIVLAAVLGTYAVAVTVVFALAAREFLRREREWAVEREDLTRRLAPGYRWWTQPVSEGTTSRLLDPEGDAEMQAEWAPSNA